MTYDSDRNNILSAIRWRQRARRVLRWFLEPSKIIVALMVALIVFFALSGCASADKSYFSEANGEPVLNLPGYECPKAVNADAHRRGVGCALTHPVRVNFDPNETDGAHEQDHQDGLVHGEWVAGIGRSCAVVLAAGRTRWKVGALICKEGNVYVQR